MAQRWWLRAGEVLDPHGWQRRDLAIDAGRLVPDNPGIESFPDGGVIDWSVVDCRGLRLVPGYLDVQINGGWGNDLQEDPELLWELAAKLPAVGVTGFLPTLTTNGYGKLDRALAALGSGPPDGWQGATPLGWHLEGPWISADRVGAHNRSLIEAPPREVPSSVAREAGVLLVTLAPELEGANALIETLVARDVVVSIGHSNATSAEAIAGLGAGATMGTHLFNAMTGLDHRAPGVAAALLNDQLSAWVGLIADGEHVSPELLALAWRLASERIVLVSDAVADLGHLEASVARLASGTIAGSLTSLDRCVKLLVDKAGAQPGAAVAAATINPAQAIGLVDRGSLAIGKRADVVALDDQLRVVFTMVGGELVFDRR